MTHKHIDKVKKTINQYGQDAKTPVARSARHKDVAAPGIRILTQALRDVSRAASSIKSSRQNDNSPRT